MNTDQKFKLLSMMGYKGPKDESLMSSFIKSNPAAEAKMGQFESAAKNFSKGGTVSGYADGGYTTADRDTRLIKGWFNTYLGREPESSGIDYYIGQLESGDISLSGVRNNIRDSQEAQTYSSNGTPTQPTSTSGSTSGSTSSNPPAQPVQYTTTSTPTTAEQFDPSRINSLYQQYLGRDAPQSGIDYYKNDFNSGQSYAQIAQSIKNSVESQEYFQRLAEQKQSNNATTSTGSNSVTDTSGGYGDYKQGGYWTQGSNGQYTFVDPQGNPTQVSSNEQSAYQDVTRLFQDYLGRVPGLGGLNYYVGQLTGGRPLAEVEAEIAQNAGVQANGGTSGGTGGWTPPTQNTGTDVNASINNTTEAETYRMIQNTFRSNLGRNIGQDGLDYYMQQVADGRPLDEVLNEIIRSPEAQQYNNTQWNQSQNLTNAQRDMATTAYTNPAGLTTMQDVAKMTPGEGTLIDPNTGQVTGSPSYQASTIDPTTGAATADAPDAIDTATMQAQTVTQELQDSLGDLEAQTALPSNEATVRGQLELLMDDFEDGTPPWASGAMRQAMGIMQQRGLGASSMAGQAVVQAAMESALPIAQQDASTYATFELRNLDNRQQTAIFKAQQRIAGIFTDQAAVNAARQFNASSENQTQQFMASLQESTARFNAAQINAVAEINVNAENAAKQFNATMEDLRDRFNATNSLAIAQSNAQWRQNINTINTAAQNDANREYVKTTNAITTAALDQLWQRERDIMSFAYGASESGLERQLRLMLADKQEDLAKWQQDREEDAAKGYVFTRLASEVLDFGGGLFG